MAEPTFEQPDAQPDGVDAIIPRDWSEKAWDDSLSEVRGMIGGARGPGGRTLPDTHKQAFIAAVIYLESNTDGRNTKDTLLEEKSVKGMLSALLRSNNDYFEKQIKVPEVPDTMVIDAQIVGLLNNFAKHLSDRLQEEKTDLEKPFIEIVTQALDGQGRGRSN